MDVLAGELVEDVAHDAGRFSLRTGAGTTVEADAVVAGLGIVPATFAFAFVGAGLDSVIVAQQAAYRSCLATGRPDCRLAFDMSAAITPELLAALAALSVAALIPVVVRRLRARWR